ncbi:MAG TPA: efflux RND transporter permease subunit, partial [Pseudomonadales bacterium]|nr:efflux RND transporter permease subunit [Pseudomonadales bacterium]
SIKINRETANLVGLSAGQIGAALRPFLAGEAATSWKAPDGENYDVKVGLSREAKESLTVLDDLFFASSDVNPETGVPIMIPLKTIAEIIPSGGATQINHRDLFREVVITANTQGRPAGDVGDEIKAILAKQSMPAGYRAKVEGANKDMEESIGYAITSLLLAVVFIYIVLASQFGSFTQPIAIMVSLPLSFIGVFLALLMFRSTMNVFSIIGMVMLMGLVTKNAILLIDFVNKARENGMERSQALMEAGRIRLRPILMTTAAMIFGMLPLAFGLGEGSEQRAPMAHALIGGVLTSTLLTLVVVPVIFSLLDDFTQSASRFFRRRF